MPAPGLNLLHLLHVVGLSDLKGLQGCRTVRGTCTTCHARNWMSMTSTRPQHKCGLLLLKNHSRSEIGRSSKEKEEAQSCFMKTCVSLTLCVVFSIERDGAKGSQKCSIFKLPGPDTSPLRVLRSAEICADPLSLSGNCECLRFGRRAKQSRILMHVVSRFPGSLQRLSLEQNQRWLRTFTSSYGKIAGNMEGICSLENRA